MKLLYIENGFGFAWVGPSGGPIRLAEVCKRFIRLGMDVYILTTTSGYEHFRKLKLNAKYYVLTPSLGLEKIERLAIGRAFSYLYEIVKVLPFDMHSHEYDAIYTSSDYLCDTILAWSYRKSNTETKWIAIVHHIIEVPWNRRGNLLVNILSYLSQQMSFRLIRDKADLILLLKTPEGQRIKSYLLKLGIPPQKIIFTINGVDSKLIEKISVQNKLYDVCCSIALQAVRGAFDIIPIFKRICVRKSDTRIIVIARGSPKATENLKHRLMKEGLYGNVELVELLPRETYFKVVKSSKIYISPKYEEGWGIAVCEAMSCGLPVVAYDLPAYEVFEDAILKVPKGDVEAFAHAVLDLLSDEKLREAIGEKAKSIANRFEWDNIAREELALFQNLVANK